MKLKTTRQIFCGMALLVSTSPAWAQSGTWADQMFEEFSHDFGVVARGADAKHRLIITNKFRDDVHIANVATSCGCTAAKPSKDTLKSREKAYVEIVMDTKKFTLQKDSSVTITFDRPQHAEIRIPIHAFIRTDVVLTPGGAEFGAIPKGTDSERKIAVAYAGRDTWTIKNIVSKNDNIVAKAVQTARGGGRVNYDLVVTAKSGMPMGEFRELLTLVTDDPSNPYVPVLVEGKVENEYTITPALVDFGTLAPGAKKTMNVVVKGRKPFTIEKIESEKSREMFEVRLPVEAKPIHILPLTLKAPTTAGDMTEEFTVTLDGSSEPLTFRAHYNVSGQGSNAATASSGTGNATAQVAP